MVGKIILSLSHLSSTLYKLGYIEPADDVLQMLEDILNGLDTDEVANIVGLRGDVKPEDMSEGFTLEPFFSDYSAAESIGQG